MPEISHCGECGGVLPDYWPKGLCPQCALAAVLEEPMAVDQVPEAGDRETTPHASHPKTNEGNEGLLFTRFGDYELLEEIGRGGMGVIYRARQISLNRTVALKMILGGQFASKQEVLRFRAEAEAAANLQHPHIVRIHETGERDGHHYFSMDYVEGKTLAEFVRHGPLAARNAARYAQSIAEAIHYAHLQGVLHRDLKPSNVIIDNDDQPRITDFGLAKRVRGDFEMTMSGQVLGSPNFMPPEQTSARRGKVGPASDVYGIGAILYHLLSGRPPFHSETIEELLLLLRDAEPVSPRLLNPSVSRDLETICLKCLEKDPVRRYSSAQKLADELGRFLRDEPIEARPIPIVHKLWRWYRRRPAIAALSGSVLLLLIVVAISSSVAAWRVNRARTSEQRANRDLRHTVSLLELERAEDFFSANDAAFGVAHLTSILSRDPSNSIAANRLMSALTHRRWALPESPPMRHAGRVIMATFNSDGRRVLSASWDKTVRIWDSSTGQSVFTLSHGDRVTCAQYNRQGDRIVTGSESGSARIWDAATGEPRTPPLAHEGRVFWAEFSADGHSVVTASADRTARIWDTSSGALKQELRKHTSHVVRARFSPDGRRVATAGSHGSVRMWRVDSGEMILRVEDRNQPLASLAFSPDGRRLLSACHDGIVRIWNADTGESMGEPIVHDQREPIWSAAFSPDSKLILTTSEDGTARLWNAETLRVRGEPMRHESGVIFGDFSPDGRSVVTTSSDNTARVWDVSTGTALCQPLRHIERVLHASFSPDGNRVVTVSYDGVAQVWELREPLKRGTIIQHHNHVLTMAFAADGNAILTAAMDKTAALWDTRTGRALIKPILQESWILSGDIAPDDRHIALACADGATRIWDCGEWKSAPGAMAPSPRVVAGPLLHSKGVRSVQFNGDGSRVVTASADGTARVWDAISGQPITAPLLHRGEVVMAKFSRDDRLVVTASEDHTARVWNAKSGQPVTESLAHIDHVKWAEFSPDGERVFTASTDNMACIWEVRTGRKTTTLHHSRIVERVAWSPDGRRVATACLDRTARIWDASTGQVIAPQLRHDSRVDQVFFSADGERLVTVSLSGQARFWDSDTGRPLSEWLNAGNYWSACFDHTTEQIAIGTREHLSYVWRIPRAPTPTPEWFRRFSETLAGVRLGASGNVELVPCEELKELVKQIPPNETTSPYGQVVLQLMERGEDRTTSPAGAR